MVSLEEKKGKAGVCYKCKAKAPVVRIAHDRSCKECFLATMIQKVRFELRQGFEGTPSERQSISDRRMLLGLSGGAASMSLLHLLRQSQEPDPVTGRRTIFHLEVAFVDDSAALKRSQAEREEGLRLVSEAVSALGYPLHIRRIEEAFPEGENKEQAVAATFVRLPSASEKQDLLDLLTLRLLADTAHRRRLGFVVLGDTATRLSVWVLAETSKGRGYAIPYEIRQRDTRFGVTFLRPLRDCHNKAVALFAHFSSLPTLTRSTFATMRDPIKAGINTLTEQFVLGLQDSFKGTVSNILRTSEKLPPAARVPDTVLPFERAFAAKEAKDAKADSTGTSDSTAAKPEPESLAGTSLPELRPCALCDRPGPPSCCALLRRAVPFIPAFTPPPPDPDAAATVDPAGKDKRRQGKAGDIDGTGNVPSSQTAENADDADSLMGALSL